MIRQATTADVPALVALGERMHKESSFSSMRFSREKVYKRLVTLVQADYGFAVAVEQEGRVVGGMVGAVFEDWYTTDKVATDFALFLEPEFRNGITAARLVSRFVSWAKASGAKQIRPGVSTGEVGAGAERLYEHFGFRRVGALFALET